MTANGNGAPHRNGHQPGWHLARTRPRSEYMAATALERNGYELCLPRVKTPRPRPGHDDSPLFPGYLFIRENSNGNGLPAIHRMAGLIGWVEFDGVVATVPHEVIDEMVKRIDAINSDGGHWKRYKPGEQVRVGTGKIDALAEVLEEPRSPESRVKVLLRFMDRVVQARVPWQDLQPLNDGWAAQYFERPARKTRGKGRWIRGFGPRGPETGQTNHS